MSHLLALPGDTLAEDDAEWMPGKSRTRLAHDLPPVKRRCSRGSIDVLGLKSNCINELETKP